MFLGTRGDDALDVLPCDLVSKQTIPPVLPCRLRDGHHERRSTTVPSSSCHSLERALAPACHQRAAYSSPSHNVPVHRPEASATDSCFPPNRQESSAPDPLPGVRKSPTDDTKANGPHISMSAHAPRIPVQPRHARLDGSEPQLARFVRNGCSSVWDARGESQRSSQARYSNISDTSSPSLRNTPPQSGHADSFGSCLRV